MQNVIKNQLLAEVGTTSISLEVRRAKAALKEATAALSEAKSNYRRISPCKRIIRSDIRYWRFSSRSCF